MNPQESEPYGDVGGSVAILSAPLPILGGFLLAVFMNAGVLKELPVLMNLPVDFTVLSVALVAGFGSLAFLGANGSVPKASFAVPLFFVATTPAFLWSSFGPYTVLKAGTFVATTLVVSIFAPMLIMTRSGLRTVWIWLVLMALGMSVDALYLRPGSSSVDRLASLGNSIALGRAAGLGIIILFVMAIWRRHPLLLLAGTAAFLSAVLVGAGSRGPFFSLPVALMVVTLLSRRITIPPSVRAVLLSGLVVFVVLFTLTLAPEASVSRLFDTGELGTSGRDDLYSEGLELLPRVPFGIGWGDWGERVFVFSGDIRLYPHNIFIEIGVEMGWVAIVALVLLIVQAYRVLLRRARHPRGGDDAGDRDVRSPHRPGQWRSERQPAALRLPRFVDPPGVAAAGSHQSWLQRSSGSNRGGPELVESV